MQLDPFLKDATKIIQRCVERVVDKRSDENIPDIMLCCAVGIERILKSILYCINPVYVYKKQDFKNTLPILYEKHVLEGARSSKELAAHPDGDVLCYRASLTRAAIVSPTTKKYHGLLHTISNLRDTIAHCPSEQTDISLCKRILLRDLFTLLNNYAVEFDLKPVEFFGKRELKYQAIAASHQEDLAKKMKILLDMHHKKYRQLRSIPGYDESKSKRTDELASSYDRPGTTYVEWVLCPACAKDALVIMEIDYDLVDGEGRPCGEFIRELRCQYCKLKVQQYDELDQLEIHDLIERMYEEEVFDDKHL